MAISKTSIYRHVFLAVLSVIGVSVLLTPKTHAADVNSSANAAQGLQISPALVQLDGDPGKTYEVKLNLLNVTSNTLNYSTAIDDFTSKDETGTPKVLQNDNLPITASMKTWFSPIATFQLPSQGRTTITAKVTIPANAEPGGHYGVIQFSGSAIDPGQTGVGISASAGTLVLITVSGAISEKADLASFSTTDLKFNHHFFFEYGPVNFETRIRNVGNVHVAPQGTIELHNMFGSLVTTFKVNSDGSNVLPSSIRRYDSQYDKKWMFGRYTADLTLGYGTTGQAITGQVSFWVIPYKLILIVLAILVTLVFILRRVIRSYNRHIIEKATHGTTKKTKRKK